MCFTFTQQLKTGNKGEKLLKDAFPFHLEKSKDLKYDFYCPDTNQTIELKTDTYRLAKTENFFMERLSDIDSRKPGGPWRALQDNVDVFIYMFINDNTYYQFNDIPALVERLNLITRTMRANFI